jgi:hypothetical protein
VIDQSEGEARMSMPARTKIGFSCNIEEHAELLGGLISVREQQETPPSTVHLELGTIHFLLTSFLAELHNIRKKKKKTKKTNIKRKVR